MISWFTMCPAMLKAHSAGTDSQVRKVRISCVACTLPMWWAFWWCLFINVSSYLPSWALSQLVGFHNVINKIKKFSFCFTNTAFFESGNSSFTSIELIEPVLLTLLLSASFTTSAFTDDAIVCRSSSERKGKDFNRGYRKTALFSSINVDPL